LQKTNAKVVATCRNPEDASELQELSQRYRDRLVILPLDITRPDSFIQLHRTLPDFGVHSIKQPSILVSIAFIEKLKTDNFVYVKFDGEILPW
jgi:NAD(P)-dependent dehydrogenase (short-subunit alcohol dehydrogenase family)